MTQRDRLVLDCNVLFQAIISPGGPAGRLFALAVTGEIEIFTSAYLLDELHELTADQRIRSKYKLTPEVLDEFFIKLAAHSTFVTGVPSVFIYQRDPDDAHYVDLALAAQARLIVSRDKDLLDLRDLATTEGQKFSRQFPDLSILTPPEALTLLGR